MIHLLYGENTFAIRERIRELIKNYGASLPSHAISSFSEENFSIEEFENALRANVLFQTKRLIIIKHLLSLKEARQILLAALPLFRDQSTMVILEEEKIDAGLRKELKKHIPRIDLEEYKTQNASDLTKWVIKRAQAKKIPLSPTYAQELSALSHNDQWRIENALELLLLGEKQKAIRVLDDKIMFRLLDSVADKRMRDAFLLYHRMILAGTLPEQIFWSLYRQFKSILLVSRLQHFPPDSIQKKTGLHPFVIKKAGWALNRFPEKEIETIVEWLLTLWQDSKLKTRDLAGEIELFMLTGRPHLLTSRFL